MDDPINHTVIEQLQEVMEDEFVDLIETYLLNALHELEQINSAYNTRDLEKLIQCAHSFKGSSSNLGALGLAGLCKNLEVLGRTGNDTELQHIILCIEQEYHRVKNALESYC